MDRRNRRVAAYMGPLAAAGVVPLLVLGVLSEVQFARPRPIAFASALAAMVALAFSLKWPARSWHWGIWATSGFAGLLMLVFIALLRIGRVDLHPLIDALAVLLAACTGAGVGSRFRGWRFSRKPRPQAQ